MNGMYQRVRKEDLHPTAQRFMDDAELMEANPEHITSVLLDREGKDIAGAKTIKFIPNEYAMTGILYGVVVAKKDDVLELVQKYIKSDQDVTANLETLIQKANAVFSDGVVGKNSFDKLTNVLEKSIRKGSQVGSASFSALSKNSSAEQVLKGLSNTARVYTDNFFGNFVVPSILKQAQNVHNNAKENQGFETIYKAINSKIENSDNYFQVVANSVVSRAYHYGVVKSGYNSGYRKYRFQAVMDSKTSEICQEAHGHEFYLYDAIEHVEKIAGLTGDELKQASPWVTEADMEKGIDSVKGNYVIIPPLHCRCRSTIQLIG